MPRSNDMKRGNFCFETPVSSLDLAVTWTVLLKDYLGTSNVYFLFTDSTGPQNRVRTLDLDIDEKQTLNGLRYQIEEQIYVNPGSQEMLQGPCLRTLLSVSSSESATPGRNSKFMELRAPRTNGGYLKDIKIDFNLECILLGKGREIFVTFRPSSATTNASSQWCRVLEQFGEVLHQVHRPRSGSELVYSMRTASKSDVCEIWKWNSHVKEFGKRTVLGMFSKHVRHQPERIAVNAWDGDLNYYELDQLSNALSSLLALAGVRKGQIVPLCFEKTMWTTVAILAVIKSGAAFVLLDENLPGDRLQELSQIVAQEPVLALTSNAQLHRTELFASNIIVVNSDLMATKGPPHANAIEIQHLMEPTDLIYVVFTSGTTGIPKAVMIKHSNVCSMVSSMQPVANISSSSRVLALSPYAFDVSIGQIFISLLSGACLCIPSSWECQNDVTRVFGHYQITYAQMTPSVSKILQPSEMRTLQVLELCGEPCSEDALAKWRGSETRVMNTYGPAECTVTAVANEDVLKCSRPSIIGKGLGACWIMDPIDSERLIPVGGVGELVLEGPQVGLGFLDDQNSTKSPFFEDPEWLLKGCPGVSSGRRGRLYRTGDLVRYTHDGMIEFIGRKDSQVKIRGQRVELGELAAHLQKLIPTPIQWYPELVKLKNGAEILTVFLVPPRGGWGSTFDSQHIMANLINQELKRKLPPVMVPGLYAHIDEIPLTMTGKTDHKKLKQIALSLTDDRLLFPKTNSVDFTGTIDLPNDISPTNIIGNDQDHEYRHLMGSSGSSHEKLNAMKLLWSEVLNIESSETIRSSDTFFGLGGESLKAIRLVSTAARKGMQIDVATIFRYPQLSELAARCRLAVNLADDCPERFSLLEDKQVLAELAMRCSTSVDNIEDAYPCTPMQEGLITAGVPRTATYVGRGILALPKNIDPERLLLAWERVATVHGILRTRIVDTEPHGLLQVVLKVSKLCLGTKSKSLADYLKEDDGNKMGLGTHLCRLGIVREAKTTYFVLTIHHAIYDGWTLPRIGAEVFRVYRGVRIQPSVGFNVFMKRLAKLPSKPAHDFWARRLAEANKTTIFPVVPYSVREPKADASISKTFVVPANDNLGVSMPSVYRAAWALLVAQLSGSDDVTFGVTISGRNVPIAGIEDLLSPTISTIPVRVTLTGAETVRSFVSRIQDEALEAVPFENMGLQNIRKINSDSREGSKFQTLFIVHPPNATPIETCPDIAPAERDLKSMLECLDLSTSLSNFNEYALMVLITQKKGNMIVQASFDDRVLNTAQIDLLLDQFAHVAKEICHLENLERPLRTLGFANDVDIETVWKWNSRSIEGSHECIHDVIARTIRIQPKAEAICAWDGSMTFEALDKLAWRLAQTLSRNGVGRGSLVPICMEKSMWAPVAMLGIMRVGAGFVAMDVRQQPEKRLRQIISEVRADWVVTAGPAAGLARRLSTRVIVCAWEGEEPNHHDVLPATAPSPSDTAFVVFTSGSTGTPKGIIITHENFCTTIRYHEHELQLSKTSRIYDYASYSFDIAVHNGLMALALGGCLCIPSESDRENDIEGSFERLRANWADLTPSVARLIEPPAVPSLKTLVLSGEAVAKDLVIQWAAKVNLINAYGPAECQICTVQRRLLTPDDCAKIGRGVGCSTWIIDPESGNLTPIGWEGELCVEGPIVSPGYLNAQDDAFIRDPSWLLKGSKKIPGRRGVLYRTGDLVRYQPDGTIIYIGRKNAQVKINGQRVELNEIEFRIRHALQTIRDVVVDVVTFGETSLICAFLLHDRGDEKKTKSEEKSKQLIKLMPMPAGLEDRLKENLPSYMIPAVYLSMTHLPLTTTRKVDRRKLRDAASCVSRDDILCLYQQKAVIEETELDDKQHRMVEAWSHALRLEPTKISRTSDFFQIGGDSISAMRLVKFSRQQGISFTVADVFRYSRFEKLCDIAKKCVGNVNLSRDQFETIQPFSLTPVGEREALITSAAISCNVKPEAILDIFPCTPFQEGVFAQTSSDASAYVQHLELRFSDKIYLSRVLTAWNLVIASNPILRTRIIQSEKGSLMQVVIREEQDWQWYESIDGYLNDVTNKPMWPGSQLSRFALVRNGSNPSSGCTIAWSIHHAVYDSWTIGLILRQVSSTYHQQKALEPGPDYKLFVEFVRSQQIQSQKWWRSNLTGASDAALFPKIPLTSRKTLTSTIKRREFALPKALPSGYPTAVLLRASWAVLMARHTGGETVLFGEMRLGRNVPIKGIEMMRGPTIASVPVLVHMDREQTIRTLLDNAREMSILMLDFEHLGLQNIARISEDAKAACNFQTLLVIQENEDSTSADDLIFHIDDTIDDVRNFNSWELMIIFQQNGKGLVAEALFRDSAITGDQVDFLLQQTDSIFHSLCTSSINTTLRNLELANQRDLIQIWNWNAESPEAINELVHDLIAEQAQKSPEKTAVLGHDGQMTYRELDEFSTNIASQLVSRGIGFACFVPLCFEKSFLVPVAMLAVLKTGAAFSVIDVSYPEIRLKTISQSLEARVVLTSSTQLELAKRLAKDVFVVDYTTCANTSLTGRTLLQEVQPRDPKQTMYVCFTSGSTGSPKGVMVTHSNIASAAVAQTRDLGFVPSDRVYDFSSHAFDANIWHTFNSLVAGACLCIPSYEERMENLAGSISSFGTTALFLTPSVARTVDRREIPTVKRLYLGGEAVTPLDVAMWREHVELWCAYGPTEVTPLSLFTRLMKPEFASNIGRGIGVTPWICNPNNHNELVAVGSVGEMCLEGPLVTLGYRDMPERTASVFIESPHFLLEGSKSREGRHGRLYKTGDLVRYSFDGTVEYMGRADTQVKLRGQRVEFGEIEYHLKNALPAVSSIVCEVLSHPSSGQPMLVAYCVSCSKTDTIDKIGARTYLSKRLPPYMIPQAFLAIPEVPRNPSGKIDRQQLKGLGQELLQQSTANDGQGTSEHQYGPPTQAEFVLQNLWTRTLGHDILLHANSDFFDVGGDSITAMKLSNLARSHELNLTMKTIVQYPKLSSMATQINTIRSSSNGPDPFTLLERSKINEILEEAVAVCGVSRDCIVDIYPCTPLQIELFALTMKQPQAYIKRSIFEVPSHVSFDKLVQAWKTVIDLNAVLRTRFVDVEGVGLLQVIVKDHHWETCEGLDAYLATYPAKTDLGRPLSQMAAIRDGKASKIVWTIHHALYDGWSLQIIEDQLRKAYHGQLLHRPPGFSGFVRHLLSQDAERGRIFWQSRLKGCASIPIYPRLPYKSYQVQTSGTFKRILKMTIMSGKNLQAIIHAAWALIVSKLSYSADVVFAATLLGRDSTIQGVELMVGPTIAPVPVRIQLSDGRLTVQEFLSEIEQDAATLVPYQHIGTKNIELINSDTRAACKFQTLIVVTPSDSPRESDAISHSIYKLNVQEQEKFHTFGLVMFFTPVENGLAIEMNFDPGLLDQREVERLSGRLESVISIISQSRINDLRISDIECMSKEDLEDIWNWNSALPPASERPVHDIILGRVQDRMDKIAIDAWDCTLSYSQLGVLSKNLERRLRKLKIGRGSVVPILSSKSGYVPLAALAILRTGAAFLPLDDTQPLNRLKTVVEQVHPHAILATKESSDAAANLGETVVFIEECLNNEAEADVENFSTYCSGFEPEDVACILFTSGTTATPKGVMQTHRALSTAVYHQATASGFDERTRAFEFASYSFDVSWNMIFKVLATGGTLCVPNQEERLNDLVGALNRSAATLTELTASVARLIDPNQLHFLETLILSGESVDLREFEHWRPRVRLIVCYGPSECTSVSTMNPGLGRAASQDGIGKGISCVTWIVDPQTHRRLVPISAIGEILIEGPIIGKGYYKNEILTKASYVSDLPWLQAGNKGSCGRSSIAFKTGDLARYDSSGNLHFISRKDTQIKLHGQRIELEEVQHHVRRTMGDFPGPVIACVMKEPATGNEKIVAFLNSGNTAVSAPCTLTEPKAAVMTAMATLDDRLRTLIPSYMVPAAYFFVTTIPCTTNGKVDRKKMIELARDANQNQIYRGRTNGQLVHREPSTPVEIEMQRLWAGVLGIPIDSVGADGNFFNLNGDSISAMRLVAGARAKGYDLRVSDIFTTPRLSELASKICINTTKQQFIGNIKPLELLGNSINARAVLSEAAAKCDIGDSKMVEDVYPCTPLQENMLAATIKDPSAFISMRLYRIPDEVDLRSFQAAWEIVSARNRILRTRLVDLEKYGLVQAVIRCQFFWSTYPSIQLFLEDARRKTMGPGSPLTGWALIEKPGERRLVWIIHHAVYDGWILPLIEAEVKKLYYGQSLPTPNPDLRSLIKYLKQDSGSSLEFWARELKGARESMIFPTLPVPQYEAGPKKYMQNTILVDLDCLPTGINISVLLYGSWSVLISRLNTSNKVAFGTIRTGRTAPVDGIDRIMGPTTTTVPILVSVDSSLSVRAFMATLQEKIVQMTSHEHIGVTAIRRINAGCAAACAFQTVLIIQPPNSIVESSSDESQNKIIMEELDETKVHGFPDQHAVLNQYGLCLEIVPLGGSITVRASFDSKLIPTHRLERMICQWEHVIKQFCQSLGPTLEVPLGHLSLLCGQDSNDIWTWNKHVPETVGDVFIHKTISENASHYPEALAIDAWDGRLTYGELDVFSSRLAEILVLSGIGPGCFVPLIFRKSVWANVSMLAVLKAGAAFVPLDADHPEGRLRALMQFLKAEVILCSAGTRDRAARLAPNAFIVDSSLMIVGTTNDQYMLKLSSRNNSDRMLRTEDLAYVVFTSGSTGTPKGVMITHKNLATAIYHQAEAQGLQLDSESRTLDSSSYSFDACIFNFFYTVTHRGCICVPSEDSLKGDLGAFMRDYKVNWAQLVPSVSRTMNPEILTDLKTLLLTGEPLTRGDIDTWSDRVRLINVYGPSECTILCAFSPPLTKLDQAGTIGRGRGANLWLTEIGNPNSLAKIGEIGEILIEGPIIGAGYLHEYRYPLVVDPPWLIAGNKDTTGRRGALFRTGDQGRYEDGGTIIFMGRIGSEIKLRGQRLSLIEVEDVVRRHVHFGLEVAADIISIEVGERGAARQILVLFVSENLTSCVDSVVISGKLAEKLQTLASDLKITLDTTLPSYMQPEAFVPLSAIPKTSSGKTDRLRLKKVGEGIRLQSMVWISARRSTGSTTPPCTKEEKILAGIWAKVLGIEYASISQEDDFFVLGGDSLGVMRLTTAAHERNILLKASDVFKNSRLKALAKKMTELTAKSNGTATYRPYSLATEILDPEAFIQNIVAPHLGISADQVEDILQANGFQVDYMNNAEEPLGLQYAYLDISPRISWSKLVEACRRVFQSCQGLRARFLYHNGKYYQVILRDAPIVTEELVSNQQMTTFSNSFCAGDCRKAKLSDVYTKLSLVDTGSSPRRVILRLSHMQNDGWCTIRILKSIASAYNDERFEKTPDWTRLLCYRQQVADESRQYWRLLLQETQITPPLVFKPDTSRLRTLRTFALPYFHSLGDNRRTRPAVVINVAWALVLQQLAGHNDVVFGNVTTGRNGSMPGLDSVVGPCVNMLPMRLRLCPDSNMSTRKQKLRDLVEASARQMDERTAFEGLDWDDMVDQCTAWPAGTRYSSAVHFRNMAFEPELVLGTERVVVSWYELVAKPHWTTVLVYPENDVLRVWLLANPGEIGDEGADEILHMLANYVDEIVISIRD